MIILTYYTTFTLSEIMKEENETDLFYKAVKYAPKDRPDRNDFYTLKEFCKALKLWEIKNGLYKPTRRDFKNEDEYKEQLEIYNRALDRLKGL